MDSQDDPKRTTRRGHPWVCVRYRVNSQRRGNHLQHPLRDDFPRASTSGRGRQAVSLADRHVSSYRDPYLFHGPASRVDVFYALPNPRRRRRRRGAPCVTIGVD